MKKILVIEDEQPVRKNLIKLLSVEGFDCFGTDNGKAGVRLAQKHVPDLIICDIMMPELDGYEVLMALRKDSSTSMIPLIFLTAKADRGEVRQGMELGADDYITKPFTRAELLSAVRTRLARHEVVAKQYIVERERAEKLEQEKTEIKQINEAKNTLISKLAQDLRDPLSNINMAIQMLRIAPTAAKREHYLKILQKEYAREMALLNQVFELQQYLSPEKLRLLSELQLVDNNSRNDNFRK